MHQDRFMELEKTIQRDYGNTAGIVVRQSGVNCYERYFHDYAKGDAFHVFSVTKSVISALVGIAIGKGLIQSVDQRVLDFFPEYTVKAGETTIQGITLAHLLSMTAPFKYETEPYEAFFTSGHWVYAALDLLGGEEYTGMFQYSPIIGAHILSGVLAKAVGQPILDFAAENLFAPLGIDGFHSVALPTQEAHMAWYASEKKTRGWVVDPQGLNTASWGLTLTAEDMAKIGQLYLSGGTWEGKQVIPQKWVRESTTAHAHWGDLSYGYLWWVLDGKARVYAAMGDGGNVIYINTKKQLVVAIASLFVPDAKDRIDLIAQHIEPIFAAAHP